MLKNLVECKVPANFLIIEDSEEICSRNLFTAFLANYEPAKTTTKIYLFCYENPPEFYISTTELKNKKIIFYNFFRNPSGWKSFNTPIEDISAFTLDTKRLSGSAFFIDSLSLLAHYKGFFTMCGILSILKRHSEKLVCVVHGDLLNVQHLEELSFLSSALIKLQISYKKTYNVCEVIYKKPGGKIVKQKEFFSVNVDFKVSSKIKETKCLVLTNKRTEIESFSTFKLGLDISEGERKAKDDLILPYVKIEAENKLGEIIYQPEFDEFEDDPDDDLDI